MDVMRMRGNQKPSWWLVYLIWFSMTGLLAWDYSVLRPEWLQKGAAVVIMLIFGGLIARWLRANQTALARR